jgi:hypothetical protein
MFGLKWFSREKPPQYEAREPLVQWKRGVLRTFLKEVFPTNVPYQYDTAFSFLQREFNPEGPTRIDLFFPDYPLAIDVLTKDQAADYREAEPYCSYQDWSVQMTLLSEKRALLDRYHCPYLTIRHYDPVDAAALKDRVRVLLGRYPK